MSSSRRAEPPASEERFLVVGPDEGETVWVGGHRVTIKAGAEQTAGQYGLIESRPPVGASPPLHIHHGVDEGVWVIHGQVRFRCGSRDIEAGPGTFVLLPADVPHTFLVTGHEDAIMLALLTPGGSERYFADVGTAQPRPGPLDPETVRRADERWRTESVVGPPLAAEE